MDLQPLTLHLPSTTYQRLVELATQSERPVAEETVHLLNSTLINDAAPAPDIHARLEQLSLLTDEELWKAAAFEVAEEDNNLMQMLLEKRQREGLTSNETEQIQALSNYFNQVMMVRAKSAAILSERGHNISALAPTP
jgi:phosphotransacetylase